jgi:hypothetical protein
MTKTTCKIEDFDKYRINVDIDITPENKIIIIGEMDIDLCKLNNIKKTNRIHRNMPMQILINESMKIVIEYMKDKYKDYDIKLHPIYSNMIDVSIQNLQIKRNNNNSNNRYYHTN